MMGVDVSVEESREDRTTERARNRLLELYPIIPGSDLESVLESFEVDSGRVGQASNLDLDDRISRSVFAHIRHRHTPYETDLKEAREKALENWKFCDDDTCEECDFKHQMYRDEMDEARERIRVSIRPRIDKILAKWSFGAKSLMIFELYWASSSPIPDDILKSIDTITLRTIKNNATELKYKSRSQSKKDFFYSEVSRMLRIIEGKGEKDYEDISRNALGATIEGHEVKSNVPN